MIEKVFENRQHRLIFVFINDYNYSSDESAEWMRAFGDTLDREAFPDRYENPLIGKMFNIIKEDNITPDERAKMKEEDNQQETQIEARQEGLEKGRKEGLEEGGRQALEKAARNLLAIGSLSAEQIASVTSLTLERVKTLSDS